MHRWLFLLFSSLAFLTAEYFVDQSPPLVYVQPFFLKKKISEEFFSPKNWIQWTVVRIGGCVPRWHGSKLPGLHGHGIQQFDRGAFLGRCRGLALHRLLHREVRGVDHVLWLGGIFTSRPVSPVVQNCSLLRLMCSETIISIYKTLALWICCHIHRVLFV